MKKTLYLFSLLLICAAAPAQTRQHYDSIKPGQVWLDTSGKPIQAHGFQIFEQDGTYYWYGENKEHTLPGTNVWTWGIRAYKSTDFYNWEDLGMIIPPDEEDPLSPLHYTQSLDRPHILYCRNTGKWVCWIKSMDTDGFFVILQADRFEGPYTLVKSLKPEGFGVGDFDLYVDPDTGQGYVWFERPHWELICAELTDDFLGTNGHFSEHFVGLRPPYTREAPAHFVRDGKHYLFTSGTSGYTPNPSKVAVFTDYHGEYTDLGCPHIDDVWQDSFGSQITSVLKIPGRDLYIALADRWLPDIANTDVPMRTWKGYETRYASHRPFERDFTTPKVKDKTGSRRGASESVSRATYVMLPVEFDADGKPTLRWQDEWRLEDYDIPTRLEVGPTAMPAEIEPIQAPFPMPQLGRPEIPARQITVKMKKRGMSTGVIQQAIDRLAAQGGGTVVVPAGIWQTGRIELRSRINLHLAEGAELHFSGQIRDYLPVVFTRDEGIDIYSLGAFIYACDAEHIALTGPGRIVGPSTDCEIYRNNAEKALNIEIITHNGEMPLAERIFDGAHNNGEVFLPKTIAPIRCRNVLIEGVTLESGLYWNVVPQYCENVVIRGVTVRSHGHGRTDGVDVESSRNVLVEYCSLDCQDDNYTLKSGRGVDGVRVGIPTENVVIRKCLALRGGGGIVFGTEVAGGIRNVHMHDCVFDGTSHAFRFKTLRPRGGGVENVTVERIRASVTGSALLCDQLNSVKWAGDLAYRYAVEGKERATADEIAALKGPYTPDFHTVRISDVVIGHCDRLLNFVCTPELPFRDILFRNVRAQADHFGSLRDARSLVLQGVELQTPDPVLTLDGSDGIFLLDVRVNGGAPEVRQTGVPSSVIIH